MPLSHRPQRLTMPARPALLLLATMLPAAAACLGGCATELTPEGKALLARAAEAYDRDEQSRTVVLASEFLQRFGRAQHVDEAYYLRGMARYRLDEYDDAEADLARVVKETRSDRLAGRALTQLGEIHFVRGDLLGAEARFRRALELLPRGRPPADRAHFRLGYVYQRLGRWREADQQLGQLKYLFPFSPLTKRAEPRIRCRAWAVQAGAFARGDLAESLAAKLREAALRASVQRVLRDEELRHVVAVGRFDRPEQAAAILAETQRLAPSAFVTPVR